MIKYATALRLGAADTEDILRRFNRTDVLFTVLSASLASDQDDLSVPLSSLLGAAP